MALVGFLASVIPSIVVALVVSALGWGSYGGPSLEVVCLRPRSDAPFIVQCPLKDPRHEVSGSAHRRQGAQSRFSLRVNDDDGQRVRGAPLLVIYAQSS